MISHTFSVMPYLVASAVVAIQIAECFAQEPAPQLTWKFPGVTATTSEIIIRKQTITIEPYSDVPPGSARSFSDRLKGAETFETKSTLKFGFVRKGEAVVGGVRIGITPKPIEFTITGIDKPYKVPDGDNDKKNDDVRGPLRAFFESAQHLVLLDATNKFTRLDPSKRPEDVDPLLWEKLVEKVAPGGGPGSGSVHGAYHREYLQLFSPPPMAKEGAQWNAESTVHLGDDFYSAVVFQIKCKLKAPEPGRPNISIAELEYTNGELTSGRSRFQDEQGKWEKIPIKILKSSGKLEFDNANGQLTNCERQVIFSVDCYWSVRADKTVACKIECDWSHKCDAAIVFAKAG